jgi:hypothetical protein
MDGEHVSAQKSGKQLISLTNAANRGDLRLANCVLLDGVSRYAGSKASPIGPKPEKAGAQENPGI